MGRCNALSYHDEVCDFSIFRFFWCSSVKMWLDFQSLHRVSQVDFIPVTELDSGDIMEWNYLDADDDVETELF